MASQQSKKGEHDGPTETHSGSRSDRSSTSTAEDHRTDVLLEAYVPTLARPVRIGSFWLAIVLPFVYVPMLVVGLSSWVSSLVFVGLLGVNVLAFYLGHAHRQ